jgi:hypothetical protein
MRVRTVARHELLGRTARDMAAWLTRRPLAGPGQSVIGHSAELRTLVFLLVGGEVLVEGLMDVSMVPPAWRPVHLLWMALMVDASLAFAAFTQRNPHRLTAGTLRIRAGLSDEIAVPLAAVASVRRERISVKGHGLRPVPGRSAAAVCAVAGATELVLRLHEPLTLLLADGTELPVSELHLAADRPGSAHRALADAVRTANA